MQTRKEYTLLADEITKIIIQYFSGRGIEIDEDSIDISGSPVYTFFAHNEEETLPTKTQQELKMEDLLKKPLSEFDLTVRALNQTKANGIYDLGDLIKFSIKDLNGFKNMGKKTITELEDLLRVNNLRWRKD